MTAAELISILERFDPAAEVRLATQPSWPLAFHLAGVTSSEDITEEHEEGSEAAPPVIWLVEGSSVEEQPYAPAEAWEAAQR